MTTSDDDDDDDDDDDQTYMPVALYIGLDAARLALCGSYGGVEVSGGPGIWGSR